jgi:hypothetical protein
MIPAPLAHACEASNLELVMQEYIGFEICLPDACLTSSRLDKTKQIKQHNKRKNKMKNIKKYAQAGSKIGEKVLLLVAGGTASIMSLHDPRLENIQVITQVMGGLCIIFGLAPMITAYVKNTLTNK